MKITLVADVFGQTNNGTSATASRLVENMKKRGHEVKVVSTYKGHDDSYYTVPERNFLIFNNYIKKVNGVALGKPEKKTIYEAIKDADVVHFLLPFKMSKKGIDICIKHNIPFTTAFHCQPENITSHIKMQKVGFINKLIYKYFNIRFYHKCMCVHCPSQFIADKLVENGYKTKNFVISNGVRGEFKPTKSERPEEFKDKFCIMLSGRYSNEKRQDLLLKAVLHSKYKDKIQVILAGSGPNEKMLAKLGNKLPNKPIMCFLHKDELIKVINFCDLYVHCSDIEIEGIGCMEAISCGIVPVLSDSKNAALYQFALSENNLFKNGDEIDLARKIDYWLDNKKEKDEMSKKYVEFMQDFKIEKCMDKMEEMFAYAIKNNKKEKWEKHMFKRPNFKKNIINVSATFSNFLGNKTNIKTLPILEKELEKGYKNVVFIILDGFGINPIKINVDKNNLLRKNIKQKLTSVFPSTTTNATTTLMSCKYPMEHGWFGWSVYLDFMDRIVDLYLSQDSYTHEEIDGKKVFKNLPYAPYYENVNTDYNINTVFPDFVKVGPAKSNSVYQTPEEMADAIFNICKKEGKQFVYSYSPKPDGTMHEFGVSSVEAKQITDQVVKSIEDLYEKVEDTLIVITADHGQVDITGYIEIYKQQDIMDLLEVNPYLESRATAFKVKEGKEKEFEKLFNKYYKKDFKLFKTETLVKKGFWGLENFNGHRNMLGDFIAVCKTGKMFVFAEDRERFKGHHTSLTKEMEVPLIILSKK